MPKTLLLAIIGIVIAAVFFFITLKIFGTPAEIPIPWGMRGDKAGWPWLLFIRAREGFLGFF